MRLLYVRTWASLDCDTELRKENASIKRSEREIEANSEETGLQ